MKKILILLFSMIIMIGAVSAVSKVAEMGPVQLKEGWNIVYGFGFPEQLTDQSLDASHIKAIYAYNRLSKDYVRMFPDPELDRLQNIDDDELLNTAFWVYSDTNARTEYWLEAEPMPFDERTIYAGWNFLGITPDMNGKTFNELKGSCNFNKMYHFESSIQEWSFNLAKDNFMDEKMTASAMGLGLVVKVTKDCRLGLKSQIPAPPSIPK